MRKQELHPRTAAINKKQKNLSKKSRSDALIWLAAEFPLVFDNSLRIRPLKIGIMDDILQYAEKAAELGISKSKLREAVVLFTRRIDYLACLKAREMRVDLLGVNVNAVTEEDAENASAKIKKRVEKSIRNARKLSVSKAPTQSPNTSQSTHTGYAQKITTQPVFSASEDNLPIYPPRAASFTTQSSPAPTRASTVVVKHKATRAYDPDAVARLKEKLGLSRSAEEKKELVD